MCGLFGSLGKVLPNDLIELSFMSMQHRGPDDAYSISKDSNILFTSAAVRLSFQDEQHGRQPFVYSDNLTGHKIVASLNGEIYNYKSLKKNLELKGYHFNTNCDTELIPALYIEYGENFVNKLDGMYAIVLIDNSKELAFLYSDFLGQKPLYYQYNGQELIFSSDLNTLLLISQNNYSHRINEKTLVDLLKYKSIISPSTIYKDVYSLGASCQVKFNFQDMSMKERKIANRFTRSINTNSVLEEELIIQEKIEDLLLQATKSRIDPSIPQAFYLSGGVDSSLVVALARKLYPNLEFNTFNLEYTGEGIEQGKMTDSKFAKYVSKIFNTNHQTIIVDPSELDTYLPDITRAYGQPFASVPSMWFVAREMKKCCKYTLSGDGADELFGSYYTHRKSSTLKQSDVATAIHLLNDYTDTFVDNQLKSSDFYKSRVAELNTMFEDNLKGFDLEKADPIKCQLMHEAINLFSSGVLTYVDRLSMAHSLEPRAPFLDINLWEYIFTLSDNHRISGGVTKKILKEIARKYLPEYIVDRRKEGFVFPLYPYIIKNRSSIHSRIKAMINNHTFEGLSKLNMTYIEKLFEDVYSEKGHAYKQAQALHSLNIAFHWTQISE